MKKMFYAENWSSGPAVMYFIKFNIFYEDFFNEIYYFLHQLKLNFTIEKTSSEC